MKAVLAATLAALALVGGVNSSIVAAQPEWSVITDIIKSANDGQLEQVHLDMLEDLHPFERSPPHLLDPSILEDFHTQFATLQNVSSSSSESSMYYPENSNVFVATIPHGFVEGSDGLVYDLDGHVYAQKGHFFGLTSSRTSSEYPDGVPLPGSSLGPDAEEAHFDRLGTVVQKYGSMYYHSVVEILPRIVALLEVDPSIKILTSGTEFERSYLSLLGVTDDQIVAFDPTVRYYAKELLYPTPTSRITPAKELIQKTRYALGVRDLPEEQRDLIIFASRENDMVRKVENEDEIISALKKTFPGEKIVKFDGTKDAYTNIQLFQRAKAVVGPHGAGLSHIIFSAPGTKVVEFIFMADPPLMFWHLANALEQEYWMLPIPYSFWLQEKTSVPLNDVKQILLTALDAGEPGACSDGFTLVDSSCVPCPEGTYSASILGGECLACFPGRVASTPSSAVCSTCPVNTYSSEGTECLVCPRGTSTWRMGGAASVEGCLSRDQQKDIVDNIISGVAGSGSDLEAILMQAMPSSSVHNGRSVDLTNDIICPYVFGCENQAPTQETISFFAPGASYSSLGLADEVEEFAEDGSRISVAFDMPPQSFLLFATPVVVDISVYNTFILRISLGNPDDLPFLFGVFQLDADQDGAPEDTSNILNLPAFVTDTTDNVMTIEIPMEGAIQSSANILFFANAQEFTIPGVVILGAEFVAATTTLVPAQPAPPTDTAAPLPPAQVTAPFPPLQQVQAPLPPLVADPAPFPPPAVITAPPPPSPASFEAPPPSTIVDFPSPPPATTIEAPTPVVELPSPPVQTSMPPPSPPPSPSPPPPSSSPLPPLTLSTPPLPSFINSPPPADSVPIGEDDSATVSRAALFGSLVLVAVHCLGMLF